MKKNLFTAILALILLSGCNKFEEGRGGMLYKFHVDKPGEAIKERDVIVWTAVEKTEEDSVTFDWYNFGRPALFQREKASFKGDLSTALGMLSEGDSATFKIRIDSLLEKMGKVKPNTKGKYLVYDIKIKKVFHRANLSDSVFGARIEQYVQAEMDKIKSREPVLIKSYISSNDLKPKVTASGLNYVITQQNNGPSAVPNDTIILSYTGTQTNGKVFDTTDPEVAKGTGTFDPVKHTFFRMTHPYLPVKLVTGEGRNIPGLEEALLTFPKGTKATVIIPSKLAFGDSYMDGVEPYTPLVYKLEIIDIIHPGGKSRLTEGASMPDFTLYRLDNDSPFTQNNIAKGKSIIILFDSNCDHCQHEIQTLGKRYADFKNVNLYLVSTEDKPQIQKFMESYGKQLNNKKNLTILQDRDRQFIPQFQATKYPAIYTYSEKHKLLKYFGGQTNIEEIIKAIKQ